ncbi:hypothetical protein WJX74_010464 [Apatococcus lobatus]|uniref:t-SNARE coiled-coil homology domain-containing protein n=1 Tax=Apatococcus lobatus TaxID=904363 RepID=A0AAW1RST9_9CHLO
MPSGLRVDTDTWLREYEQSKQAANDVLALIQDRNTKYPSGGPEASRVTATARKKLGTLGTSLENLREALETGANADVTENEKNRRRDMITALKGRREQMLQSLRRDRNKSNRADLMDSEGSSSRARETEQTADLDNRGLLQMQNRVMQSQDNELEELERTVASTRHISLAINEELDLQARLLDDLDEDVEVSHSKLRAASKRLRGVMQRSGSFKCTCLIILLGVILVVVLVLALKIAF